MNKIYFTDIYVNMASMFLVLTYAIISGVYILVNDNYNLFLRFFVILIISVASYMMFKRDTFLSFLGISFLPNTLIVTEKVPQGANVEYTLDMQGYENGTRVVYWAANKTDKVIEDPFEAYKDFHNAGVSVVSNQKAIIKVFCPDKYKVNGWTGKQVLDKHFHYRVVFKDTGLMSPVMTAKLNC